MLQITRKPGQAVVMGTARVVVLGVTSKQVRLGIEAPRKVRVCREEIAANFHSSRSTEECDTQSITADATVVTAEMNPTGLGVALIDVRGNIVEIIKPADPKSAQ